MSEKYDPKEIEPKWQKYWEENKIFTVSENSPKPKYYSLMEFPYPSGEGLHTGHVRGYTAMDIISRKRRMEGYNVLFPIGWDAFGLPTENYAIKTGTDPKIVTKERTDIFRGQFKRLGMSFDSSREINTTDPKYYKWTQWIFLQFLKHGLAYKAKTTINWCPKDKIGLANEEVVGGVCDRCGTPVEKREKEQWILGITKYADRLEKDLEGLNYSERIYLQQKNWIGASEGTEIDFELNFKKNPKDNENRGPNGEKAAIKVFTTRPDTIYGATYLVLSPEHLWVTLATDDNHDVLENKEEIKAYVEKVKNKTDIERTSEGKEKTGVEIKGVVAINPATKEEIPIFVADYVLPQYGTGAIMAVPAHDERDFEFAKRFNIPIHQVTAPIFVDKVNPTKDGYENTERNGVIILVKHWSEDKYLLNYSPKFNWKCLFTGGIEEGEDPLEAARREIQEESGYKNVKYVSYIPLEHIDKFHAPHKGVNRTVYQKNVFIELKDGEQDEISDEEKNLHHLSWLTKDEMRKTITLPNHLYIFDTAIQGGIPIVEEGVLINSGEFNGLSSEEAKKKITESIGGKIVTRYKLRDWIFSRQRYWGEPIPVIHCSNCGTVPVPEKDLPVVLPEVEKYEPTDTGESPLANIYDWVNVNCPKCGGKAKRETDVMPNWAGSSWYFLRYTDPENEEEFASMDKLKYWMPVDWYNGGIEHTVLHLLYSRFWNKFLFDIGVVPTSEPYKKRTSHGLILAEGGEKMSKSKGNVINPDDIVKRFGADSLRLYEMFMGPFEQAIAWSEDSLSGPYRFIEKVWKLYFKIDPSIPVTDEIKKNQIIKKVSEDIESMKFNTAISSLMVYVNELEKKEKISTEEYKNLILIISPFAPHVAEELWQRFDNKNSLSGASWPTYDEKNLVEDKIRYAIQINGKTRTILELPKDLLGLELEKAVLEKPEVGKWVVGVPKKVLIIPQKVVNILV